MSRPRLALLDASHGDPHTPRNFRRELAADVVEFDACDGDLPPGNADIDGAVITGSRSSVYWDEDWIADLVVWTADATDRECPVLGVCFGHQVLAEALGGTVESAGDYELGYRELRRTADDPLLADVGDRFVAFTTHQDTVTELPPGATLLAENGFGVQAFRHGDAWGVQFHPEYDRETAREIVNQKRGHELLSDAAVAAALDGITDEQYAAACETKALFDAFVAAVRARRAASSAD